MHLFRTPKFQILIQLAEEPVSIIFVAIGKGDLTELCHLEAAWKYSTAHDVLPYRKFVHVIHFRSLLEWESALMFYRVVSHPSEIFKKEILTPIRDQALDYMRRCWLTPTEPEGRQ